MQYVMIKPHAPSVDGKQMQLYLYAVPMLIVEETENEVLVFHKDDGVHAFWFNKDYIDRFI